MVGSYLHGRRCIARPMNHNRPVARGTNLRDTSFQSARCAARPSSKACSSFVVESISRESSRLPATGRLVFIETHCEWHVPLPNPPHDCNLKSNLAHANQPENAPLHPQRTVKEPRIIQDQILNRFFACCRATTTSETRLRLAPSSSLLHGRSNTAVPSFQRSSLQRDLRFPDIDCTRALGCIVGTFVKNWCGTGFAAACISMGVSSKQRSSSTCRILYKAFIRMNATGEKDVTHDG